MPHFMLTRISITINNQVPKLLQNIDKPNMQKYILNTTHVLDLAKPTIRLSSGFKKTQGNGFTFCLIAYRFHSGCSLIAIASPYLWVRHCFQALLPSHITGGFPTYSVVDSCHYLYHQTFRERIKFTAGLFQVHCKVFRMLVCACG